MSEIRGIVETLVEGIRKRVIADLKGRKKVGVSPLIKELEVKIIRADEEQINVQFVFKREVPIYSRINDEPYALDPMFKVLKPMYVDPKERETFGQFNIYNRMNKWLEKEVIPQLAQQSVNLARNVILEIIR
jgi:hypothetical protein